MMKKVPAMFMAVVLAAGLCPAAALAGPVELAPGSAASGAASNALGVAGEDVTWDGGTCKGTCGGCDWSIDGRGLLTIAPTEGAPAC